VSPIDTTDPPANRTCQRCLAMVGWPPCVSCTVTPPPPRSSTWSS